jgi:hypothetical protein
MLLFKSLALRTPGSGPTHLTTCLPGDESRMLLSANGIEHAQGTARSGTTLQHMWSGEPSEGTFQKGEESPKSKKQWGVGAVLCLVIGVLCLWATTWQVQFIFRKHLSVLETMPGERKLRFSCNYLRSPLAPDKPTQGPQSHNSGDTGKSLCLWYSRDFPLAHLGCAHHHCLVVLDLWPLPAAV